MFDVELYTGIGKWETKPFFSTLYYVDKTATFLLWIRSTENVCQSVKLGNIILMHLEITNEFLIVLPLKDIEGWMDTENSDWKSYKKLLVKNVISQKPCGMKILWCKLYYYLLCVSFAVTLHNCISFDIPSIQFINSYFDKYM